MLTVEWKLKEQAMHFLIENANKDLIKAFHSMAKAAGAKLTFQEEKPSKNLLEALQELQEGKVEQFEDFEDYKKAMDS